MSVKPGKGKLPVMDPNGKADCYIEHEIMIWDVAAGIALVEGAGGKVSYSYGSRENSMNVLATNNNLHIELK